MNPRSAAAGATLLRAWIASGPSGSGVACSATTSLPAVLHSARCLLPLVQQRNLRSSGHHQANAQPQPKPDEGQQQQAESSSTREGSEGSAGSSQSQQQPGAEQPGSLFHNVAKEVRETIMPLNNLRSYTRKYKGAVAEPSDEPYTGTAALAVVKQQQTAWQKAWSSVHDKLGHLPFFSKMAAFKVTDTTAYQKGQQLVEDLKEKYETSDHPVVHKVEEYKERVFAGSEASRAMMEIRTRDPSFDMNVFLRSIKLDAPVVTKAFLTHDMDSLNDHCGPEIMQRLEGLCKAFQQQELREDPTILFVGDVEMVELRLMENDPFVICQFHCQQLKCVRDKFGNVVDGSPDTIHRVYYFWGLQQEKHGVVTASGELLPPRWVIKDMLWQSMLALV